MQFVKILSLLLLLVLTDYNVNGWHGLGSSSLWLRHSNKLSLTADAAADAAVSSTLLRATRLEIPQNSTRSSPSTTIRKHRQRSRIPILAYHDDWVCVNKPPGITVHRSQNTPRHERVLTTAVKKQLGRKVYPVHRLDHRTSGALLLAFGSEMAGKLHDVAIRHGSKQYIALLRGQWTYPHTTRIVDQPLRDQGNVTKEAQTKFTLLATTVPTTTNDSSSDERGDGQCSLVLCEPITGRTHQIRRHARDIDHPIIGDSQHGISRVNRYWRERRGLDRLALHCWTLEFTMEEDETSQESHCIVSPLPAELRRTLETYVPIVWKTAMKLHPRLLMEPYDETGGTHGRHYRSKQLVCNKNGEEDGD